MVLSEQAILHTISQFTLPGLRVSGFIASAPIFNTQIIPRRIRIVFVLIFTMIVAARYPSGTDFDPFSLSSILIGIQELLIGASLGFVLQISMQVFIYLGSIIGMQAGLGFASMVDPQNGVSVPALSQFYLIVSYLLFFATNGHLAMIDLLVHSFEMVPIAKPLFQIHFDNLCLFTSMVFLVATILSMPIIIVLLIINISFGVVAKSSPQFNLISLGFPITLVISMFLIMLTLSDLMPNFEHVFSMGFDMMNALLRGN